MRASRPPPDANVETQMKRGRFCWCCRRRRPNERFSGRNHSRCLCRDCARLPAEEREFRQGELDIERLMRGGLYVPRKRRAEFDRFLAHPNARVRELARQILAEQQAYADEMRRMRDEEESWFESQAQSLFEPGAAVPGEGESDDQDPGDDEDLPF